MAYKLPEKLSAFTPYEPLSGQFHVRSDANESFLDTPEGIRAEICDAISGLAFHRYPDPYCTKLREKAGAFYQVSPNHIVAGNGSDELIGLVVSTFSSPGATMVVVKPDFSMYTFYAQLAGLTVKAYEKDAKTLRIDPETLIAFTKVCGAEMLLLSNPCNPTSVELTQQEILHIVKSLDCLVVVDEAYMDFSGESVLQHYAECDNLMVLKTCSKAFGMAAIRLGFAVSANREVIAALNAVKSPYNVGSMTQAVGSVLFSHPQFLKEQTEKLVQSCQSFYQALCKLKAEKAAICAVYDSRTNFVFLQLEDAPAAFEALKARGIAVRCMQPFLRISAGSAEENRMIITALAQIL